MVNLIILVLTQISKIYGTKHNFVSEIVSGHSTDYPFESIYSNEDYNGGMVSKFVYSFTFVGIPGDTVIIVVGLHSKLVFTCETYLSKTSEENPLYMNENLHINAIQIPKSGVIEVKYFAKINKSGLYSYFITDCNIDKNEYTSVTYSGFINFNNPFGYIPAHRYPFIRKYFIFGIIHLTLLIIWSLICYLNKNNVTKTQRYFQYILILSCLEMFFHFLDSIYYNKNGFQSLFYFFAKIFLFSRQVLCRILLIYLSCGINLSKKTIMADSTLSLIIKIFTTIFLFLSIINEYLNDFKISYNITFKKFLFRYLLGTTDIFVAYFILYCGFCTFKKFSAEEKTKKNLFRQYSIIFASSVGISLVTHYLCVVYLKNKAWLDLKRWSSFWLYDFGLNNMSYLYTLISLMYVTYPSRKIFGYTEIKSIVVADSPTINKNLNSENDSEIDIYSAKTDLTDSVEDSEEKTKEKSGEKTKNSCKTSKENSSKTNGKQENSAENSKIVSEEK